MSHRFKFGWMVLAALLASTILLVAAPPHQGRVLIGEVPVPGVIVTATQGGKKFTAATSADGSYSLPELTEGTWTIQIEMTGFASLRQEITAGTDAPPSIWTLKMLPLNQVKSEPVPGFITSAPSLQGLQVLSPSDEPLELRTANGLLINGSVSNGASTPFALSPAFGNNRRNLRSPYNWNLAIVGNNAALDARPFSLTGQDTPQPAYSRIQSSLTVGGPLRIPLLFRRGNFNVTYSRTQNRNASLQTALMPTPVSDTTKRTR